MTATLFDHLIVNCSDSIDDTFEVDVDTPAPCIGRRCVIGPERKWHGAGVVDEHVDRAEVLHAC
jgi:hypothetical protein